LLAAVVVLAAPQAFAARNRVPISSYDDDPFVASSAAEVLGRWGFGSDEHGKLVLWSDIVAIEEEPYVYRADPDTGEYHAIAWNPWLPQLRWANGSGDFLFPGEERFPFLAVQRDSAGDVVYDEGLQVWLPQELRLGMTTAFEAATSVKHAGEAWSGRAIAWGEEGRLFINAHTFIDLNAFYSPSSRSLFFGVLPYRLAEDPGDGPVRIFETATSWDIAAHESGHALHAALKPNRDGTDLGYRTWSESFGDQFAMWTSLRDRSRVKELLAATGGDLAQSNAVTRVGEVHAAMTGQGTALRDAFHAKTVSSTTTQMHDRSEVLTGAAYDVFLALYEAKRARRGPAAAVRRAARVLGRFLVRAADFTPENRMTLEDVAKAYLKVDEELFGGRHRELLVEQLTWRELLDADSLTEWLEHESSLPDLFLPPGSPDDAVHQLVSGNLDRLGLGPHVGLLVQSVTAAHRARRGVGPVHTIVRVQLTLGRDANAFPLANHGILVFDETGRLIEYHTPIPPDDASGPGADARAGGGDRAGASPSRRAGARGGAENRLGGLEVRALIADIHELTRAREARPDRADRSPASVALVTSEHGRLAVEARELRGHGMDEHVVVFTLEHPEGERREVVVPPVPPQKRIALPAGALD
jgi:hypothetical protein